MSCRYKGFMAGGKGCAGVTRGRCAGGRGEERLAAGRCEEEGGCCCQNLPVSVVAKASL